MNAQDLLTAAATATEMAFIVLPVAKSVYQAWLAGKAKVTVEVEAPKSEAPTLLEKLEAIADAYENLLDGMQEMATSNDSNTSVTTVSGFADATPPFASSLPLEASTTEVDDTQDVSSMETDGGTLEMKLEAADKPLVRTTAAPIFRYDRDYLETLGNGYLLGLAKVEGVKGASKRWKRETLIAKLSLVKTGDSKTA